MPVEFPRIFTPPREPHHALSSVSGRARGRSPFRWARSLSQVLTASASVARPRSRGFHGLSRRARKYATWLLRRGRTACRQLYSARCAVRIAGRSDGSPLILRYAPDKSAHRRRWFTSRKRHMSRRSSPVRRASRATRHPVSGALRPCMIREPAPLWIPTRTRFGGTSGLSTAPLHPGHPGFAARPPLSPSRSRRATMT